MFQLKLNCLFAKSWFRRPTRRSGATRCLTWPVAAAVELMEDRTLLSVSLGTAETFGVLGGSTVANVGATVVTGDLGVSPGSSVTGSPTVTGTIHTDSISAQAHTDVSTAAGVIAAKAVTADLSGQNLGGMTLTPGVYHFSAAAQLTGTLTLNAQGNPDAEFYFQVGTTLTTASNASIVIINGGDTGDVFWQVGSSATIGTATAFAGHILAQTGITLQHLASLDGNALAISGAVNLDDNSISVANFLTAPFPFPGEYAVAGAGSSTLATISQNGTVLTLTGTAITTATIKNTTQILVQGTDTATYGNSVITFPPGIFASQTWTKLNLPTDFTNPAGARVHITQNGSSVTFTDRNGNQSPGTWNSPTQLSAYGETVTVGSGATSGQLLWSDGTVWSLVVQLNGTRKGAAVGIAAVPSKVIVTDYLTPSNKTVHTVQTGTTNIIFVDSIGSMVLGTYSNSGTNVPQATAPNYPGYTASIVGNTITWTNGIPADTVVWTQTSSPAATLTVTNYTNQNGVPVHLIQNGTNVFAIVDGMGNTSLGHFTSANTGVADNFPNDVATFSGNQVIWQDGVFVWTQTNNPPLLIAATDQNGAASHLGLQTVTTIAGLDGPLKGVIGTRENNEIEWSNGDIWKDFDYDLLNALIETGTGFP